MVFRTMNADMMSLGLQLLEIIWINILLSGDNAVVIALACRSLPPERRQAGILLGAGAAVGLRVIFTAMVVTLLALPWLKLGGGILLLGIAINLVKDDSDEHDVAAAPTIWGAVRVIAIADLVMSLDNVIAIAAAAKGSYGLIIFGLLISVPLIVFGASIVMAGLTRYPALVWVGAALLGFVAGELIAGDPILHDTVAPLGSRAEIIVGVVAAALVVAVAYVLRLRRAAMTQT